MQTSPLRDSGQSSLWPGQTCPAPAQSMGHSPPMLPYGHSPLRTAAPEPPQAVAASCWLQSQGLPQLGRQQPQQFQHQQQVIQHHQPEVSFRPREFMPLEDTLQHVCVRPSAILASVWSCCGNVLRSLCLSVAETTCAGSHSLVVLETCERPQSLQDEVAQQDA